MPRSRPVANKNSLRIIAGTWRSRRLQFNDSPKIRPTPDRVRETLFNWLAEHVDQAKCLDLFAGSGALGFESVSRGASSALLIENDEKIAAQLMQQKQCFKADTIEIKQQSAVSFLQTNQQQFDLVFLDPPFDSPLLEQVLPLIHEKQLLSANGLLYIESSSMQEAMHSLETLECIREKVAGEVRYALYRQTS